jgi:N-acetylglucosaminyldiphosphoundecaprenol N-acetyl-beta-D-mannosaminyltransferase
LAAEHGFRLFLLGGRPGVAAAAADAMRQRCSGLHIAGTHDGYFHEADTPQVIAAVNQARPDVLLVGFGVPRQELWLSKHRDQLHATVRMGVGGLFDYYSGRIPRAPQWLREIGLEWVWRLWQEPGRLWKRYIIGNPLFLYRVWRQRGGVE